MSVFAASAHTSRSLARAAIVAVAGWLLSAASCAPSADGPTPLTSAPGDAGQDTSAINAAPVPGVPTREIASAAGPYRALSYTSGFRDGPGFADATIFYPSDAPPPHALTVVVPGFASAQTSIVPWGTFLASHGIVTMTIGTNGLLEQPDLRGAALLDALNSLKAENERADSPLKRKLDPTRAALMGWSMGAHQGRRARSATTPARV